METIKKDILKTHLKTWRKRQTKKLEETNKSLKETKENQEKKKTTKQMKQTVQGLKSEIETIKKTQIKGIEDMENMGKQIGTTEVNITNRIQEMEERILRG